MSACQKLLKSANVSWSHEAIQKHVFMDHDVEGNTVFASALVSSKNKEYLTTRYKH